MLLARGPLMPCLTSFELDALVTRATGASTAVAMTFGSGGARLLAASDAGGTHVFGRKQLRR
jgi:hypothetical protein